MELTKSQIRAANTYLTELLHKDYGIFDVTMNELAKLLQFPWDPPSEEEITRLRSCLASWTDISPAIQDFISRRNEKLASILLDPRREQVREILNDTKRSFNQRIDAIMALVTTK